MKKKCIMLSMNGPDNGCDAGKAYGVQFGYDCALDLDPTDWPGGCVCRLDRERGILKFSRHTYKITGWRDWVGNWCWNAVWMRWPEAKRFIRNVKASGKWQVTGGLDLYINWFESTGGKAPGKEKMANNEPPRSPGETQEEI